MTVKIVNIQFENFKIKGEWNEKSNDYYFPVLEIISKLSNTRNPQSFWINMKKEYSILSKLSDDNIEVVDLKDFFRIIQLIQSPSANQIKIWLAELGAKEINNEIIPKSI